MDIKICPSCGSEKLKRIRGDLKREFEGESYSVTGVEYYQCPDCGERVYDRDAVRRIQAESPAFDRHHSVR